MRQIGNVVVPQAAFMSVFEARGGIKYDMGLKPSKIKASSSF